MPTRRSSSILSRELVSLGLVLLALVIVADPGARANAAADWAASPEAYFLTPEERREWKALSSSDLREQFKATYWRRRNPAPDTEDNEFRQIIEQRIRVADERYTLGKTAGSRTARGLVFIVLGSPSVEKQTMGPLKSGLESNFPGQAMTLPREAGETKEWHYWTYEPDRLPLYLRTQPSYEIAFIIEPGVRDEIQKPQLFGRLHNLVARHSIVNQAEEQ
jgi:GWxTD domain-containing protein